MNIASTQKLPFDFSHSSNIKDLGIKTYAWIEHNVDNSIDTDKINLPYNVFYSRANADKNLIEKQIKGYTDLRQRIGRSSRRFPPSAQAIQDQFVRNGNLYSISMAVDIYNLVSLATGLSIGAHDLAKIHGNIRLDMTQGSERFLPLGSDEERLVPAGEYAYLDEDDRVLCRMEYRQSALTCLDNSKQDCLFIVQGHQHSSDEQLQQAADEISNLLQRYCHSKRGKLWINL